MLTKAISGTVISSSVGIVSLCRNTAKFIDESRGRPGLHLSLKDAGLTATLYLQLGSLAGVALGGWIGDRRVAFGIGRGIFDSNCMPALCQIAPDHLRSTGYGWFNLIGPLAGGAITAAAGALKSSIGIGGAIQITGVILLLSAVILGRNRAGRVKNLTDTV